MKQNACHFLEGFLLPGLFSFLFIIGERLENRIKIVALICELTIGENAQKCNR